MLRVPYCAVVAVVGWATASGCSSPGDASLGTGDTGTSTFTMPSSGDAAAVLDTGTSGGETGDAPEPAPTRDAADTSAGLPDEYAAEDFEGIDGEPWPSPWVELGGVIEHGLEGGRGRMRGPVMTVARMGIPGLDALDFDAEITVEFTDATRQIFGLHVRQNGGRLVHTDPPGQGYGVLLEGGEAPELGIWRERAGVEELVGSVPVIGPIESLAPHRVRLQCIQLENATLLRAKIWRVDASEPHGWAVELIDVTPELQGVTGGLAVDLYDELGSEFVFVDDLVVRPPA